MPIHLYRMLGNGRSEAEKNFATAFFKNFSEIDSEISLEDKRTIEQASEDEQLDLKKDRIQQTFSSESDDSGMFWTFAPYIYKNLPDKSEIDRLRKIFRWACLPDTPRSELKKEDAFRQVHLKGVKEICNDLYGDLYYLTINPEDLTHKFTDQEAKKLVKAGIFK